ncbi:MAG TPA: MBL fold metallo-hydrolase [Caulobacteraceae bacterium]|jgi:glyoxylase-like metal-dependent hydrolase (beta-lactamase superfamily II)
MALRDKTLHLLAALAAAAFAAAAPIPAAAQSPPATPPFELKTLAPGVYAAIDGPGHKAGSNAGIVVGDDGVAVVDAFFTPDAARALLATIRQITSKPVRYVVNTHYHVDHTGGDQVFRDAGAVIIAHRNVRAWLRTENPRLLGDRITPAQRALIASLPEPDLTTTTALTIWLGTRRLDVKAYPGHTGGDLIVAVPDAKTVFTGDLLWRHTSPNVIDGRLAPWIATDDAFLALPDSAHTTFVPGHGQVANAADVAAFRDYLSDLLSWVREARAAGLQGQALTAQVLPKMKAKFGDWDAFDYFIPKEIGFAEAELDGTKYLPPSPTD